MWDLKLEMLKLWGSKHLNIAILLMRAKTVFFQFYLPWWMAILGGLYLLNLTLIAAKGRLSASADLNLRTSWEQATREAKRWNGWEEKEQGRERGWEGRPRISQRVSEISPWVWSFNWGLAALPFYSFLLFDSVYVTKTSRVRRTFQPSSVCTFWWCISGKWEMWQRSGTGAEKWKPFFL